MIFPTWTRQQWMALAAVLMLVIVALVLLWPKAWHPALTAGDPTLADAILDRLVHDAHRLALKGSTAARPGPGGRWDLGLGRDR